jgi:nitroreductase
MKSNKNKKDKLRENLKNAVDISQRAQRNFDLSKQISQKDFETLIYIACNSPSKQNETHYDLYVFTDYQKIREIYETTKLFLLYDPKENLKEVFGEKNGEFWQSDERSVHNSQTLSNMLLVYVENQGDPRGGTHAQAKSEYNNAESIVKYNEQISYSIGISSGQVSMAAAMLGYKTGYCSAFKKGPVKDICGTKKMPKLMLGIGYENLNIDRRQHAETLNSDVPEGFQTGLPYEKWRFPSFEKQCKVYLNGSIYNK